MGLMLKSFSNTAEKFMCVKLILSTFYYTDISIALKFYDIFGFLTNF